MEMWNTNHERLGNQVDRHEVFRNRIGVNKADIEFTPMDGFDLLVGVRFAQHVLDIR